MSGYIKISASSEISARFESTNVPVIGYGSVFNREKLREQSLQACLCSEETHAFDGKSS